MEQSDRLYLMRIREYCEEIAATIVRYGASFDSYLADMDYQKSIAFSILQIGELAGHLTEAFRRQNAAEIPWAPIRGMRNAVVHGYGNIDHQILWDTAVTDIPILKAFCDRMLHEA